LETQTIIDTCIANDVLSLVWSPNSKHLVYSQRGRGQQSINVYDIETNNMYTVAYYEATYLAGWRAD
jgi:tricorn protease-like protein